MVTESAGCELRLAGRISNLGHRAFPLGCQITEDGFGIFTLAHGEGKLWNRLVKLRLFSLLRCPAPVLNDYVTVFYSLTPEE